MFYVQYGSDGTILATDSSDGERPLVDNATRWELEFPEWVDTTGKKVDVVTQQLVDAPPTE